MSRFGPGCDAPSGTMLLGVNRVFGGVNAPPMFGTTHQIWKGEGVDRRNSDRHPKAEASVRIWAMVLLAAIVPTGACAAEAQTDAGIPIVTRRSFETDSKVLGERRVIEVSLPVGYDADPQARYPVVVVLDGEFEHEVAAAIARFHAATSQLPPLIVVGVNNTNRMRDLTPAPVAGFRPPPEAEAAGGADRFLAYLADELLPYLDSRYRTAPMRVLVGHSLGGLFALHALASRPDLFTGYLVMEPSTWWNNQRELEAARAALGLPAARRARVIMVNGELPGRDTTAWGGAAPMLRGLRVPDETHSSMAAAGMVQGLRTMFADFKPSEWWPGTRPIAMLERYDSLAARVGFQVPIPERSFSLAIRMSLDSRHFDDAERALTRMEQTLGVSDESRTWRDRLARERGTRTPAGFIPLEFPARRPSAREAAAFLGRWETSGHQIEIRAAGDSIVVRDRVQQGEGGRWVESDDPVIQITADGTLEWGLRWFNGIAALLVLRGRVMEDGTMVVTRQVRGWVPRGPGGDFGRVDRFRRVAPN